MMPGAIFFVIRCQLAGKMAAGRRTRKVIRVRNLQGKIP